MVTFPKIKYRVWDNQFNIWVEPGALFLDQNGKLGSIGIQSGKFIEVEDGRYTISYSTGVVDRNGFELYDGDIVRANIFDLIIEDYISINFTIRYDDEYAVYYFYTKESVKESYNGMRYDISVTNDLGIIGNIFENFDCL